MFSQQPISGRSLRILMAAPAYSIHSRRPLRWLLDAGHEVWFVDVTDPLPEGHPKYHFRHYPRVRAGGLLLRTCGRRLGPMLTRWLHRAAFRRLHWEIQPELTHVHWVDHRAYEIALQAFHPLVLTAWGSDINRAHADPQAWTWRHQVGFALRTADLVMADAPDVLTKAVELAGRALSTALLPVGIDTERFSADLTNARRAWRQRLGANDEDFIFASMRAWHRMYNHHLVLEAFAQACRRLAVRAYLLYKVYYPSGKNPAPGYEEDLRKRAAELGVQDRVFWLHEVPYQELPAVYAAVDSVVNAPEVDGFPVLFLEAAAARKPVVSVRLPAYEGTFAADCFQMVPTCSVPAMAEAMVMACRKADRDARKVEQAFDKVVSEGDERVVARKLQCYYAALCSAA